MTLRVCRKLWRISSLRASGVDFLGRYCILFGLLITIMENRDWLLTLPEDHRRWAGGEHPEKTEPEGEILVKAEEPETSPRVSRRKLAKETEVPEVTESPTYQMPTIVRPEKKVGVLEKMRGEYSKLAIMLAFGAIVTTSIRGDDALPEQDRIVVPKKQPSGEYKFDMQGDLLAQFDNHLERYVGEMNDNLRRLAAKLNQRNGKEAHLKRLLDQLDDQWFRGIIDTMRMIFRDKPEVLAEMMKNGVPDFVAGDLEHAAGLSFGETVLLDLDGAKDLDQLEHVIVHEFTHSALQKLHSGTMVMDEGMVELYTRHLTKLAEKGPYERETFRAFLLTIFNGGDMDTMVFEEEIESLEGFLKEAFDVDDLMELDAQRFLNGDGSLENFFELYTEELYKKKKQILDTPVGRRFFKVMVTLDCYYFAKDLEGTEDVKPEELRIFFEKETRRVEIEEKYKAMVEEMVRQLENGEEVQMPPELAVYAEARSEVEKEMRKKMAEEFWDLEAKVRSRVSNEELLLQVKKLLLLVLFAGIMGGLANETWKMYTLSGTQFGKRNNKERESLNDDLEGEIMRDLLESTEDCRLRRYLYLNSIEKGFAASVSVPYEDLDRVVMMKLLGEIRTHKNLEKTPLSHVAISVLLIYMYCSNFPNILKGNDGGLDLFFALFMVGSAGTYGWNYWLRKKMEKNEHLLAKGPKSERYNQLLAQVEHVRESFGDLGAPETILSRAQKAQESVGSLAGQSVLDGLSQEQREKLDRVTANGCVLLSLLKHGEKGVTACAWKKDLGVIRIELEDESGALLPARVEDPYGRGKIYVDLKPEEYIFGYCLLADGTYHVVINDNPRQPIGYDYGFGSGNRSRVIHIPAVGKSAIVLNDNRQLAPWDFCRKVDVEAIRDQIVFLRPGETAKSRKWKLFKEQLKRTNGDLTETAIDERVMFSPFNSPISRARFNKLMIPEGEIEKVLQIGRFWVFEYKDLYKGKPRIAVTVNGMPIDGEKRYMDHTKYRVLEYEVESRFFTDLNVKYENLETGEIREVRDRLLDIDYWAVADRFTTNPAYKGHGDSRRMDVLANPLALNVMKELGVKIEVGEVEDKNLSATDMREAISLNAANLVNFGMKVGRLKQLRKEMVRDYKGSRHDGMSEFYSYREMDSGLVEMGQVDLMASAKRADGRVVAQVRKTLPDPLQARNLVISGESLTDPLYMEKLYGYLKLLEKKDGRLGNLKNIVIWCLGSENLSVLKGKEIQGGADIIFETIVSEARIKVYSYRPWPVRARGRVDYNYSLEKEEDPDDPIAEITEALREETRHYYERAVWKEMPLQAMRIPRGYKQDCLVVGFK